MLSFDARRLLSEEGHRIFLSPINSGNARRAAAPRSRRLFVPYREWIAQGWPAIDGRPRAKTSLPAEIVAEGHLPLKPYVVGIE